jgi:hypothetical protein
VPQESGVARERIDKQVIAAIAAVTSINAATVEAMAMQNPMGQAMEETGVTGTDLKPDQPGD